MSDARHRNNGSKSSHNKRPATVSLRSIIPQVLPTGTKDEFFAPYLSRLTLFDLDLLTLSDPNCPI